MFIQQNQGWTMRRSISPWIHSSGFVFMPYKFKKECLYGLFYMGLFLPTFAKIQPLYPCHSAHIVNKGMIPQQHLWGRDAETHELCVYFSYVILYLFWQGTVGKEIYVVHRIISGLFFQWKARVYQPKKPLFSWLIHLHCLIINCHLTSRQKTLQFSFNLLIFFYLYSKWNLVLLVSVV